MSLLCIEQIGVFFVNIYCICCKDTKAFFPADRMQKQNTDQTKKQQPVKIAYQKKTKRDTEAAIRESCKEFGLGCRFVGTHAYITTSMSEWFFDYTQPKINLYHENKYRHRNRRNGLMAAFHTQGVPLFGWRAAITYIRRHDKCYDLCP